MSRTRCVAVLFLLVVGVTVGSLMNGQGLGETGTAAGSDLSGVWAMVQITSETVRIPIVGERTRTTTTHLRLVIERNNSGFSVLETHCAASIDDGTMMVETTIPDAFQRALGVTERAAHLVPSSGVDQPTDDHAFAPRIVFPWNTQLLGVRLDDPENDALPSDATDPRVFDQDNDGHPGMTVRLEIMGLISGEVYVVQRNRNRLVGTVVSAGFLRGTIEWETDQVILGASSPFLASGGQGSPDPDPERNFFLAKRIDPALDCADIQQLDLLLSGG